MRRSKSGRPATQVRQPFFERNQLIKAGSMRVLIENGDNLGVLTKEQALQEAYNRDVDLIMINPNIDPPIAKLISWSKFKYELSKKQRGGGKKSAEVKEMWFKPFIEEADLQHKAGRVREFAEKGHKVKISIRPKRGKPAPREKMYEALKRVLEHIGETVEIDGESKLEGRNLIAFVKHKK